ncbi:MAG TPA: Nif3-like dinuclear metal center hexameric protein [Chitinophagaceae bacterium]|nr:Nif3-like dinuclear metal center hexameric protein [Chitinophagaceae bacterium]
MKISEVIHHLENIAPPGLQESYDNAGLLTGNGEWACSGMLICLDATEDVMKEAVKKNCNLVIAHHPILFRGLKRITGSDYVQKALITSIKNDIAVYAIHTNLDNILGGVSGKMAEILGLQNIEVLSPKENILEKLYTFVPAEKADQVREAIFQAGGGNIGKYAECSFNVEGFGTFTAQAGADPYIGKVGTPASAREIKIEVVFPSHLKQSVIKAMLHAHPYEEVAYDVVRLENSYPQAGAGAIGSLAQPMEEGQFLRYLKQKFNLPLIRHTPLLKRPASRIAVCGGAGSFLISKALAAEADFYVTSDVKYHEFFDANNRMVVADIGHFESEQFTIELLHQILVEKFPTFAVLKSGIQTNPVNYYS